MPSMTKWVECTRSTCRTWILTSSDRSSSRALFCHKHDTGIPIYSGDIDLKAVGTIRKHQPWLKPGSATLPPTKRGYLEDI